MSSTSGVVEDETLTYHQGELAVTIPVETPDWQFWLENATSFTFRSKEGSFTAQKLRASNGRGGWYWYAYRRQHGHLSNFYLGTSSRLTRKRLDEAARSLAQAGTRYTSALSIDEVEMSEPDTNPLLLSKLHIPRLSPQHISRPRLLKLLDEGTQRPLTLISAPAGSGKTTLLVEWATTTRHSLAWISLEATDNDPSRFLSYLLEALASLKNGREANYHPTKVQSPEHALATMLNGLTRSLQEDTILVLDDYHLLTSEAISALLRFLIDHLPAHLHLLLGTRIDPPLPLARLRARGQLSEIGLQELRFRSEEVDALVQTMGLSLSSEATNLLEQHAEGWAAGIQLLALALRGQPNATAFLRAFQGTHRFLLDYVSEEVLKQQTPEVQHFLLYTCMLTSMTGLLCEAMTGLPDGQARLEDLRHANLFVSTLDDAESWYRYHPLFAETLRAHLQKTEPELLPELYLRASSWYEQHQNVAEACEYALLAEDFSRAARLMTGIFPQMIEQGHIEQLSRWLSQLPPALIADSPQLYIATPWLYSFSQRLPEQREQAFKRMQQHVDKQQQKSGSTWTEAQSVLTLFQALTAMSQSNLSRAFSLIRKALRALTARQTALSQLISRLLQIALSVMYGESGDLASAEQILLDLSIAQPEQPFSLISLAAPFLLGELYKAQGKLHKAEALYEGLGNITPLHLEQPGMPLLVVNFTLMRKASLLYEWNRLSEAAYGIQQVLEILPRAVGKTIPRATQPAILAFGLWVRAHIELAQGYPETARYFLDQVCQQPEIMAAPPKEKSPVDIPVLAARLALACGRLEDAIHWESTCEIRFDDTPGTLLECRQVFVYLTLARVLIARGRSQHAEAALAQAIILLEHWRTLAERLDFQGWLIEIQMLTALALQAQNQTRQALITLGDALSRAEMEGFIRLFADEGEPMAHLLPQVTAFTSASQSYIQRIRNAMPALQQKLPAPTSAPASQALPEPLSKREQEVLALLVSGASNQQIADSLVISLNTAKRHVKNILSKLEVSNRTQAVARARALQLL